VSTKTSEELRAELTMTIYGIDPATLLVSAVTVTRGGVLTLFRTGGRSSSYRIRGGKPPRSEVARVFGLTDILVLTPEMAAAPGGPHPLIAALEQAAAARRDQRDSDGSREA
jgi:hypothetical protein